MKKIILLVIGILFLVSFVYAQVTWGNNPASTEFDIADSVPVCDRENYVWKQWVNGELEEWDAMSWCHQEDGIPNICCPVGYECGHNLQMDDPNYMTCYKTSIVREVCEDYTDETTCNSAPPEIAAESISRISDDNYPEGICADGYVETDEEEPYCIRYADCLCHWKDGNCSAGVDYSPWYCYPPGEDPIKHEDDDGICVLKKSTVEGNCQENSFITIKWEREWVSDDPNAEVPDECSGSFTRTIACPERLMFFTTISLIIAVSIITVIYVLKNKKR